MDSSNPFVRPERGTPRPTIRYMTNAEIDTAAQWLEDLQSELHHLAMAIRVYYGEREQGPLQADLEAAILAVSNAKAKIEQFKTYNRPGFPRD